LYDDIGRLDKSYNLFYVVLNTHTVGSNGKIVSNGESSEIRVLESSREVPGKFQESSRKVPGKFLESSWKVPEKFLKGFLKGSWKVPERFLKGSWKFRKGSWKFRKGNANDIAYSSKY
jgi:hypothetical protein